MFWVVGIVQLVFILQRRAGHYEFPFFFIATSLLYFGGQLILFSSAEGEIYGREIAAFVLAATASNFAVHMGFNQALRMRVTGPSHVTVLRRTLLPFLLLVTITLIGFWSFAQLAGMAGGLLHIFDGQGNSIVWEDSAVHYIFAVQNLYFVFPIALFFWKQTDRKSFLLIAVIALLIPAANAFLLNRRFVFFLLSTTFILFLLFQYKFIFSRIMIFFAVPISMLVVTLFPLLRGDLPIFEVLSSRELSGLQIILGQHYGEVKNGVLSLSAIISAGEYEFGVGFFKQLFKDFIPSALIGRENKISIIGIDTVRFIVYNNYYYRIPENEYITGIVISIFQFSLLSLIMWYYIGYLFGRSWSRAYFEGELRSKIMYTAMVPVGMMALYYSPTAALSQSMKVWIIVQLTIFVARVTFRTKSRGAAQCIALSSRSRHAEDLRVSDSRRHRHT